MKPSRILFPALIGCAMVVSAVAQDQTQAPPQSKPSSIQSDQTAPPSQAPVVTPDQARTWVPEGIAALGQNASSRTEFTLDHSMLVLASKLDKGNEDLRRVIAGVNGISVHSFRLLGDSFVRSGDHGFDRPAISRGGLATPSQQAQEGDGGLTTDLWVHLDHASIRDVAVLFVGVKDLNFISVSGSITPLDLLHLSGHFGIPKMDEGVVVPAR